MKNEKSMLRPGSLRAGEMDPAANRVRSGVRNTLALGMSALALTPLAVLAQQAVQQLDTVKIEDTPIDPNPNAETGVPYKAKTSGDERHTRPIAETPQSISVLTKSQIDDSGYTDLKQILDAQPGITSGTGENGNAFGDRYIIRGQEARSDVFVDGLRDPGMTTRESFAIEQLEISRGPDSSFAGRGTAGGAINAITKQPTTALNFAKFSAAFGTDKHSRLALDYNQSFGESFAVRANALYGYEEVPDRAPADRERKGLAVSGMFTPNEDLTLVLDYYGMRAKDNPDLWGWLLGTAPNRRPAKNFAVYAQENDFQKSDVDTFTLRLNYEFSPDLTLISKTRYGMSDNGYITSGASGSQTRYLGSTGEALPAGTASLDGGHSGWQDVDYFAHQDNLRWDKELFGRRNEFIFGVEYTNHRVVSAGGNSGAGYEITNTMPFNCRNAGTGSPIGDNNAYCFAPKGELFNGVFVDPATLTGRVVGAKRPKQQNWHVTTWAPYIMDTLNMTDRLTLFAGLRLDNYDLTLRRYNQTTGEMTGDYKYGDTLVNGHLGLTFKLNDAGMIYASAASAQDINGGEPDSGTNSGYGGLVIYDGDAAGAKPETSINLELGTKWNLFQEQLLVTAALFQTTKSDVMEGANYDTVGTFNTGKNRVRGFEFDVVGMLTSQLQVQAGFTTMDSEVLESVNAASVGKMVSNFARHSAYAQMRYDVTDDIAFGVTGKYKSKRYGGQPDTAAGYDANGNYTQPVPGYVTWDLFASYKFTKNFDARLNVGNVFDKDYYLAVYRSGSFLYKGDARTFRLTFNYSL